MSETAAAAAAHAASATLITQSRRSRGRGRRRSASIDRAEEAQEDQDKQDQATAAETAAQEQLQEEKKAAQEKERQAAKKALAEAEKRAAELLVQVELAKSKIFRAFETENTRFNEQVQKTRVKFDKATYYADRDQLMKEVTKMNKLDRETELLLQELDKVSQRKPPKKSSTEIKEGKEGKDSTGTNSSKASKANKANSKANSKANNTKGSSKKSKSKDKEDATKTDTGSAGKGVRLNVLIKKILNEMPLQLVKQCKQLCQQQRLTAYNITEKNVRDIISACGERGLIEDILDRKFKLYKVALQKKREARGERNQGSSSGHGASVVSKDELAGVAGGYPLCVAARQGQHNICKHLLDMLKGDAVNILDSTGIAPILLAARGGYDLMTKHLLDSGAFADAVDSGRCNALMLAARQENRFCDAERQRRIELQKQFSKYNKKKSGGGGGGKDGSTEESELLGFRPLEKNHNRVLKLLLAVGANFNHRDSWGKSVLTHAAECGNHAGARMLLRAGARVDAVDNQKQWTSLHYAVFNNHFFTAHNLIKGKANVDLADDNGITPLILASNAADQQHMVELLVYAGANTGLTSTYGQSCASCAGDRNDVQVLDILRNGVAETYDPDKVVVYVRTSRGLVKRRRKKKKKAKKVSSEGEEKISEGLLNPRPVNESGDLSVIDALANAKRFDDDDSGVEDIPSHEDFDGEEGVETGQGGEEGSPRRK